MTETVTAPQPDVFRRTLAHFASGVTVVTGLDPEPVGFTCQSFQSVSIDPPLVSISIMKTSTTYPRLQRSGRWAVSVLSHQQSGLSSQFARSGSDKWSDVAWTPASSGNPVLENSAMWVDCETWAEYDAGDHLIVLGRVVELSPPEWHRHEPLLFFKGAYRSLNA